MTSFKKGIALTIAGGFLAAIVASVAYPQGAVTLVQIVLGNDGGIITASNPLPVSGSFSASFAGFPTTQTTGTPISVTTGGVSGTLPAGTVVVASNVGTTNAAYCKLGASATTSDQYIAPSGGWFAFTVGASTQLTCITSTSTTTVNMVGGSGLPTGTGGGSGGGGGGGAVTIASGAVASGAYSSGSIASGAYASGSIGSGAMVDLGAIADAAATAGSTGSVSAKLRLATTQLATINTTLGTPFQAGGALAANQSVNVAQINGVTPLMGNGVTGTGSPRVTIASDNTAFSVNATLQASSATAIGTVNPTTPANWGIGATAAGVPANAIYLGASVGGNLTGLVATSNGLKTDGSAVTQPVSVASGQIVDGGDATQGSKATAACATDNGTCEITALIKRTNQNLTTLNTTAGGAATLAAAATGGCTSGVILSAASNNSTSIKGSAGTLCELVIIQTTTTLMDVRLYDTGSAPTCSSATGVVANYVVQSNATSPGMVINLGTFGKAFASGIGICITGANANNDNTNAATGLNVNYSFK